MAQSKDMKAMDRYEQKVDALLRRHGYSLVRRGMRYHLRVLPIRGFVDGYVDRAVYTSPQGIMDRLMWLVGPAFADDYHRTFPM